MLFLEIPLSSRIVFQFTTRTALARDCRVLNVPDDKSHTINFVNLYMYLKILSSGTYNVGRHTQM